MFLQALFPAMSTEDTKMRRSLVELIKGKPMDPQSKQVRILPKGETVVRMGTKSSRGNSAVINTYQLGTEVRDDLQKTCQLKVMAALTGAAVYNSCVREAAWIHSLFGC